MTGTICVNKSQFVPVIFEPPCTYVWKESTVFIFRVKQSTKSFFLDCCKRQ